MSDTKIVEEPIDGLMKEKDSMPYKELVEKIEDLYNKNMHKAYEEFSVSITKDSKVGWALIFNGKRPETTQETAEREAKEAAQKKATEKAELQLYLKLHRKYGKKKKSCGENCDCN